MVFSLILKFLLEEIHFILFNDIIVTASVLNFAHFDFQSMISSGVQTFSLAKMAS